MTERIPLLDLHAHYEAHREEFDAALANVIGKSAFIGGEHHKQFAEDFAAWCGGGHVALTGNGTDALELAIIELLGYGDGQREIITASHTFIATAEAIGRTGYRPVFVDVDPSTCLMDLEQAESAINARTAAIIPVHIYGQMLDVGKLRSIAVAHNLVVIEDAAQAHGADFDGFRPGDKSELACFSFYPGKNLGGWGDGGAIYGLDEKLIERITMRANHGRLDKYLHEFEGMNSRLDGLQAAILLVKLRHLDAATAARRQIAKRYDELLGSMHSVKPVVVDERANSVYHLYVVRLQNRDRVREYMQAAGISTGIHYPVPLHMQPAYQHLAYAPESLPETRKAADEILSLPIFPEMTNAQVDRVVSVLNEAVSE